MKRRRLTLATRVAAAVALLTVADVMPIAAQTPAPSGQPAVDTRDSLAFARKVTLWFYSGMADSLWANMTPRFQEGGSKERILQEVAQFTARLGTETEVVEEKFVKRNGRTQYWRTANYSLFPEPFLLRWVITSDLRIDGVGMGPRSQAPPVDP
ncbi:MAG: hypothetical protein ABR499_03540 [Gemmatimonadaceae bacterium]